MTQSKLTRNLLSLLLSVALMFTTLPVTAVAEDGQALGYSGETATSGVTLDGETPPDETETEDDIEAATPGNTNPTDDNIPLGYSVVAFAELSDEMKNQTVPFGTALEDLALPDSLDATVSDGEDETDTTIEGVTWQSAPEYAAVTIGALEFVPAGTYVFTSVLPEGYTLSEVVDLPVITVELQPMGIVAASGIVDITAMSGEIVITEPTILTGTNPNVWVVVKSTTGIDVTLSNLNITIPSTAQHSPMKIVGKANITLVGDNTLDASAVTVADFAVAGLEVAGFEASDNNEVTIDGDGSLTAKGGQCGAGICNGFYEAPNGTITIKSGTIIAAGGQYGAGIGGGGYSEAGGFSGKLTIDGGTITAYGGMKAAGIGGGGGNSSAIGSWGGFGGTVIINNGIVTAFGGGGNLDPNVGTQGGGAGIGGGGASEIYVGSGGGFGGGSGIIIINGGVVTATGAGGGAGIGGGAGGNTGSGGIGETITITGGYVNATGSRAGVCSGAGIGGGGGGDDGLSWGGSGGTITISGGEIIAASVAYAAVIGGGSAYMAGGDWGNITISNGVDPAKITITNNSSQNAVKIGSGFGLNIPSPIGIPGEDAPNLYTVTFHGYGGTTQQLMFCAPDGNGSYAKLPTAEYLTMLNPDFFGGSTPAVVAWTASSTATTGKAAGKSFNPASSADYYLVSGIAGDDNTFDVSNSTGQLTIEEVSGSPDNTITVSDSDDIIAEDIPITETITLTGTNPNVWVVVKSTTGAKVKLDDLNITIPSTAQHSPMKIEGKANITLEGDNTLDASATDAAAFNVTSYKLAGLEVSYGNEVTIGAIDDKNDESGKLTTKGGYRGPGIGGCAFDEDGSQYNKAGGIITINSGTIIATGGLFAAGINGGTSKKVSYVAEKSIVTINGGNITAIGGDYGAGIGGEHNYLSSSYVAGVGIAVGVNGGEITINGGTVTAYGGENGAGIGGGGARARMDGYPGGNGGTITINGGNVVAKGYYGAGIGGGGNFDVDYSYSYLGGSGGNITITGGNIYAVSIYYDYADEHFAYGAGIGGGGGSCSGGDSGTINITGGNIVAGGRVGIGAGTGDNWGDDRPGKVSGITITSGVDPANIQFQNIDNVPIGGGLQGIWNDYYPAPNLYTVTFHGYGGTKTQQLMFCHPTGGSYAKLPTAEYLRLFNPTFFANGLPATVAWATTADAETGTAAGGLFDPSVSQDYYLLKEDVSGSITFNNPESVTYDGNEHAPQGASINTADHTGHGTGTWTYTYVVSSGGSLNGNNKPVGAGTYTVTAKYADDTCQGKKTATFIINKANPSALTLPAASGVTYGAALSTSNLTGGSTGGSWAWTTPATIPTVVNSGYSATFTPDDTDNYNWAGVTGWDSATSTVRVTVNITVSKATPTAPTFPTSTNITYGAALSTSNLSGGTGAGEFAWTNGATIPTVTNSGYSVTFTPDDADNYDWTGVTGWNAGTSTVRRTVSITVSKATPSALTPPDASGIIYGAALSTSNLTGGTSGGTWEWTYGATIPTVTNSGYEATFTPTDTANYDWSGVTMTATVSVAVSKATQAAPSAPTLATSAAESVTLVANSAYEFSEGGTNWQTSEVFSGLTPNTSYNFYARLPGDDNHNPSPASPALTVTTPMAALTGTPTIDNTSPQYLDTLTVNTSTLVANPGGAGAVGALSYQWNRGDSPISSATGATYTVQTADINAAITVTVTAANCSGAVTSAETSAVAKRTVVIGDLTYSLPANVDYNGNPQSVSVTAPGKTGFGVITVKYNDSATAPTNAGAYTITVSIAEGANYAATTADITLGTFTINTKALSDSMIDSIAVKNYTGSAIMPEPAITDGQTPLTKGTDFDYSYANNTNAGTATLTITGKGNYSGSASKDFTINGIDIPLANLTITSYSGTYDGDPHSISVSDSGGGTVTYCATETGTYTATNPTYTNAGTYTVYFKVNRGGNYNEYSDTSTVTISKAALTIAAATISAKTYDGTTTATVTGVTFSGNVGTLALGTDFTATGVFNSANAGTGKTVTVTVTLGSTTIANNHSLSVTAFSLTSQSIAQAAGSFGTPSAIDTTYTPTLTLADLSLPTGYTWDTPSTALSAGNGQSFAAKYNNPNGNYTEATGNITVNVAKANQATLTVDAVTGKTFGNTDFQLATSGGSGTGAVSFSYVSGPATLTSSGMLTITGAGNIVVNATKAGDTNYNGSATSANRTITVAKAPAPTISWPTSTTITYGAALSTSALTPASNAYGSFAWTNGATIPTVTNSGYSVTFTPSAATLQNYEPISSLTQTVSITVNKATTSGAPQTYEVVENNAQNYSFDLTTLLPNVSPLSLGTVTYEIKAVTNTDVLSIEPSGMVTSPLTLNVASVAAGKTAIITVTVHSGNYNDFDATITVNSVNKIPVTITGVTMTGGVYKGSSYAYSGTPVFTPTAGGTAVTISPFNVLYESTDGGSYNSATAPTNAGAYKLTLSVPSTNATYTGSTVFTFTITQKQVTVKADDKSAKVDGTLPTPTVSYTGFVGTDNVSNALTTQAVAQHTAADTQTAGTFPINITTDAVLNATNGANYTLSHQNGTLTVTSFATFTITATAGSNGSISPSGAVLVTEGDSRTFTVSANNGYHISSVTVDGVNKGAVSSYTFTNVTGNHTISASFTANSTGSSGGSGGGSGDSGGGTTTTTTTPPAETWLEQNPAGTLANGANSTNEDNARTTSNGAYGVRATAWAKLAGLRFEHDTMDGNAVQVRLYINSPETITKDMMVSGYVKGTDVDYARNTFEKYFDNRVRTIHFDQQDAWGQPVNIAARVDLTLFDTKKLYFYAYDKKTNIYRRIEKPAYWIDKNGYLHFTTEYAGDIIISENPLEKK